jgi:hypothetical protein
MINILGKLFGGESRVKIMRLFLFNPEKNFIYEEVSERAKVDLAVTKHEIKTLRKIGMIRNKKCFRRIQKTVGKKKITTHRKISGWVLNNNFSYLLPLQNLLINKIFPANEEILSVLGRAAGKLRLVILAGIFIQNPDSRVDLLVVGDNLRKGALDNIVKNVESQIGKEIKYAAFNTQEFQYRLGIYDKLIRDILDYPHEKVLNRLGILV